MDIKGFHNDKVNSSEAGITSSEYWAYELWDVAPTALALSYRQLYEYVNEKNIGCTLFLIRDVFELMIKIPVTVIFNGIHELKVRDSGFSELLTGNSKIKQLYEYSMQMLSSGKWWECVRIASRLDASVFCCGEEDSSKTGLYVETVGYLKKLYDGSYFKNAKNKKTSMVSWRNNTIGHSCLADDPEAHYGEEIPNILKMFKALGDSGIEYYKKVCLTDGNKRPLRGVETSGAENEVYIQYIPNEGACEFREIHNFIAGRNRNLSCFDGFEKGKAYLLNYGNGDRYRDQRLSEWLAEHRKDLKQENLSEESVYADDLESKDIEALEQKLSVKDDILGVKFLGKWVMDSVNSYNKGFLLLTAERGLGKSTFCSTLDPFEDLEIKYDDEKYAEELEGFLGNAAVRVWHFNSEYRSRKDIFIPGIRDLLLTIDPENRNRLCGAAESRFSSLLNCNEEERGLKFAECLNAVISEYRTRTDKEKLLLILDGLDEVSDLGEICSFIPDPGSLDDDIFILFTSRTVDEITESRELCGFIDTAPFESHLSFTREGITVKKGEQSENIENSEYRDTVLRYVKDILREQGKEATDERAEKVAETFEFRMSSLAAYRKLCRLSPVFNDIKGADLFDVFMGQVELNSPKTYVERLKRILNTLAHAGEPITLRELAYLSGERYVSYRLLGMINDIQAFITVSRSSRGNRYELSHSQWEKAVKKLVHYGDVYFRKQCNELLAEMEEFFNENNITLILEKSYEGELWLLMHILNIYNRSWEEIEENWFEEIRLGSFEYLIELFLKSDEIVDKYFTEANIDEPYNLMNSYYGAIGNFGKDNTGIRGSRVDKKYVANPVLMLCTQVYERMKEYDLDIKMKRSVLENLADSWTILAASAKNKKDKDRFKRNSLEAYSLELELIDPDSEMKEYSKIMYNIGFDYYTLNEYEKAYEYLSRFLFSGLSFSLDGIYFFGSASLILGKISEKEGNSDKAFAYYDKTISLLRKLVKVLDNATVFSTLAWAERILSEHYENKGDIDKAIEYRAASIRTECDFRGIASFKSNTNELCVSWCKMGELYEKKGMYREAKGYYEEALSVETEFYGFMDRELYENLVRVCTAMGDTKNLKIFSDNLKKINDSYEAYNNACSGVLAVLSQLSDEELAEIPEEVMEQLRKNAISDYDYRKDSDNLRLNLSEQGKILLDHILTQYLNKYSIRDRENERKETFISLKRFMDKLSDPVGMAQRVIDKKDKLAFCDAFWWLSRLPSSITKELSVETLMWVKEGMGNYSYERKFPARGCSEDALALIKYVLGDLTERL